MAPSDELPETALSNVAGGGQKQPSMCVAIGILGMLTNQQTEGLEGFVQRFARQNLGDIVSSWISNGANLPISAQQIQGILGGDALNSLAQRAGVAPDMASALLAQVLPGIVDMLTPGGTIPESGTLLEQSIKILKEIRSRSRTP